MYANHYQHEYQGKAVIDGYHRDAIRAGRLRVSCTTRRASVVKRIRTLITSLLIAAGRRTAQTPATHSGMAQEPVDKPLIA